MVFAYSLCSQLERELIATRTKDSLARKKKEGLILGRPKNKMILDNKAEEIKKMLYEGVKINNIAKKFNSSRSTISKLIKKNNYKKTNDK
jgi:DNA invertase Pin-like site-specific DNA recombinase